MTALSLSRSTLITRLSYSHSVRTGLLSASAHSLHQTAICPSETLAPSAQAQTISRFQLPQTTVYEHTRPQPRAPVRARPYAQTFRVNDDEAVLDRMYERLFGHLGIHLMPELRWQAITHKSFDHGRQPYNDKLAFMGRRVLFYHANLHLIDQAATEDESSSAYFVDPNTIDESTTTELPHSKSSVSYTKPVPFEHPSYKNLNKVTYDAVGNLTSELNLINLARMAGIQGVIRWVPRNPEDLIGSGQEVIAVEGLFAIVGAIALTRGGYAASEFVKSRILTSPSIQ